MSKNKVDIGALEAQDLTRLYKKKKLSPVEAVRALLAIIDKKQSEYNLFITVTGDLALQAAAEAEKRMMQRSMLSPLDGVPFAVKDVIYTKGIPTTSGCEIYRNFIPAYNATVVDKMQDAGAVLMGKLNTHQFAFGPTGDRTITAGPARNPKNPQKVCGGSSSASAGAVAGGLVPVSLGTDSGGSMRVPSAFCGVVGMKPTHGRTSIYGIVPISEEVDHVGPHTRKVYDNAAALNILAGYDPKDYFSVNVPVCPDYTQRIGESIKGAVIGVPCADFIGQVQPGVLAAAKNAIAALESQGAAIKEIKFPDADKMAVYRKAHQTVLVAGGYTVHERDILENRTLIAPEVLERLMGGKMPASEYIRALHIQPKVKAVFNELMRDVDILMTPTVSVVATDLEAREVIIGGKKYPIYEPFTRFTWLGDFTGFPCLSMPCGESDGLPVGVQMMGHPWEEDNVYRFATALERALS